MRSLFHMVPWPSGKARVCKTLIRQFKSGRYLQKRQNPFGFCLFCRPARFEDLNATVRGTVAAEGSTEANNNFSSRGEEKCNQIWPVPSLDIKFGSDVFYIPVAQGTNLLYNKTIFHGKGVLL